MNGRHASSPADPAPSVWDSTEGCVAALMAIGVPDWLADRMVTHYDAGDLPPELADYVREAIERVAA